MKKSMKAIALILIAILAIACLSQVVLASEKKVDGLNLNQFDGKGDAGKASDAVTNIIGSIINIVQIVGTGVAIIMLVVLAIKYISAAPGDKADIKKHAVVYIVGAVVLFAATGILQIVKNFASSNINDAMTE